MPTEASEVEGALPQGQRPHNWHAGRCAIAEVSRQLVLNGGAAAAAGAARAHLRRSWQGHATCHCFVQHLLRGWLDQCGRWGVLATRFILTVHLVVHFS